PPASRRNLSRCRLPFLRAKAPGAAAMMTDCLMETPGDGPLALPQAWQTCRILWMERFPFGTSGVGRMGRDWLRQLNERWPALAQWAGGRLEIELPAFLASLILHVLILTALAMVSYRAGAELQRDLQVRILDAGLQGSDLTTLPYQDLDQ